MRNRNIVKKKAVTLLTGMMLCCGVVPPVVSNAAQGSTVRTVAGFQGKTTESLNVRKGPSVSYDVVKTLPAGTTVTIKSETNGWYKIESQGVTGYVNGKYIKLNTSTSTGQSQTTSSDTKVIATGVVTATLNVRSGGSVDYSIKGGLSKGTKVEIVSKLSNGWCKIKYGTGYGYVNGKYIEGISSSSSIATVKEAVYLRNDASWSATKGVVVKKDEKVEVLSKGSSWTKVKYNSSTGYIANEYLIGITSSTGGSTTTPSTSTSSVGYVNADSLNVREGSSTAYSVLGGLQRGAKVEIVAKLSNGWYKIKYRTGYGYVSGKYISDKPISAGGNTTTPSTSTSSIKNQLNDYLFIGDSFTHLLQGTIKANNTNTFIYSKSGSQPGYWIDRVASMPSNSMVKGVVLLIGVNGASYSYNRTDVKTLITKLSQKYPNKTIYVQKVFPVGQKFANANPYKFNQSIAGLNDVIKSHCYTLSNVKFIDTTNGFVSNGYLRSDKTYDGLHISSTYNNEFYTNIVNAVKKAK